MPGTSSFNGLTRILNAIDEPSGWESQKFVTKKIKQRVQSVPHKLLKVAVALFELLFQLLLKF